MLFRVVNDFLCNGNKAKVLKEDFFGTDTEEAKCVVGAAISAKEAALAKRETKILYLNVKEAFRWTFWETIRPQVEHIFFSNCDVVVGVGSGRISTYLKDPSDFYVNLKKTSSKTDACAY
jgi:hypothetical protein